MGDLVFPLHVRRPEGKQILPAICDATGRVIAQIPGGRNIWEWSDYDAAKLVAAANGSASAKGG